MNNLPLDIQENIYKRLPPKDRVKLKLVLPKTSARIYKPKIERKLAVVNNYINKNKVHIKDKTKLIPLNIMSFIKDNQNDNFIKKLGNEIDIYIDDKDDSKDINKFLDDIQKRKIKDVFKYEVKNLQLESFNKLIIEKIYSYANIETFEELYKHPDIIDLFNDENNVTSFIFGLINHQNKELLEHIMTSDKYEWINIGKLYINRPTICSIFASNQNQIKEILKYFDISLDSKLQILEKAEENLYEDTALLVQKYI